MQENPESGIQQIFAVGIRNQRLESGIHNGLESGIQKVGIQNPDTGIRNLQAGIRNPGPSWILLHSAILFEREIEDRGRGSRTVGGRGGEIGQIQVRLEEL